MDVDLSNEDNVRQLIALTNRIGGGAAARACRSLIDERLQAGISTTADRFELMQAAYAKSRSTYLADAVAIADDPLAFPVEFIDHEEASDPADR